MAKAIARHKPDTINDAAIVMHKTVAKMAHKAVKANKADFEDVYQYGMMGVTRAYYDYDTDNPKAAFSTVAYKYAFQHIMDMYMRKQYDYVNNRDFKSAEDHLEKTTVENNTEDKIYFEQVLSNLDTTDRIIMVARSQGYTYQECADMLNKCGNEYTLHQVRNREKRVLATL